MLIRLVTVLRMAAAAAVLIPAPTTY